MPAPAAACLGRARGPEFVWGLQTSPGKQSVTPPRCWPVLPLLAPPKPPSPFFFSLWPETAVQTSQMLPGGSSRR